MKGLGVRVPRRAARSTHQSGAFGATGRFRGAGYPLRSPDSATRGLFLGLTDEVLVGVGFGGHCALEQPLRPNEDSRQPSTQVGPESRSSYRISDGLPVDPENGGETQGARRLVLAMTPAGPGQRRFPHLELDGVTLRVSIRSVGRPLLLLTGIGANLALSAPFEDALNPHGFQTIAVDAPATGGSTRYQRPRRMPGLARTFERLPTR
jgi:hypothetical protein